MPPKDFAWLRNQARRIEQVYSGKKGAEDATQVDRSGAFGLCPKRKNSFDPKNTDTCSNRKSEERYHESELFSIPVRACHLKKQSFINDTGVKLISLAHRFYASRAFYQ